MASTKKKNEIIDFYKLIPKNMSTAYHNPKFKDHGLKIPLRALIVGGLGAGKTQLLINIIHKMSQTFERIVICLKCKDEPLYNFLASKCKNGVSFHEGAD